MHEFECACVSVHVCVNECVCDWMCGKVSEWV